MLMILPIAEDQPIPAITIKAATSSKEAQVIEPKEKKEEWISFKVSGDSKIVIEWKAGRK